MEKLQINCPDGHIIDTEKSDLEKGLVFFKVKPEEKKKISYKDVAEKLFGSLPAYFINASGEIGNFNARLCMMEPNNSATKEQLESILALNMLCNVAKYLNDGWLPNFNDTRSFKWCLYYDFRSHHLMPGNACYFMESTVYFETKKHAEQALEILGEEVVKKALTLNH